VFLVQVTHDVLETVIHEEYLMKACAQAPLEHVAARDVDDETVVWGPEDVFGLRSDGWVLRSGDRVIAKLPDTEVAPAFGP
jgi:hypothetical protein